MSGMPTGPYQAFALEKLGFEFANIDLLVTAFTHRSYVNEHKHLPGMPSAAEMDANGVSVSKMSNLLLEKVEELTLHMIKLEKENAALKARVQELEK